MYIIILYSQHNICMEIQTQTQTQTQIQTQIDDQNLIRTQFQVIKSLSDDVQMLKHDVQLLKSQNEMLRKQKFDRDRFSRIPTVSYLSTCNLDRDAMGELLNMLKKLDFSCIQYLIDCWVNGLYKWDDLFVDHIADGHHHMLIHYVCACGNEQAILYMLDIYAKRG